MNLFRLKHRGGNSRGFPYAHGYGKFQNYLPFLLGKELELREQSWQVRPRPAGIITGDNGTKWGDLMECSYMPPSTFISERVLQSLCRMNGQVLTQTEFPIAEVKSKKLHGVPPPRYFAVQWAGGIEVDWDITGRERDAAGNLNPLVAKVSTWNGTDIFSWTNWDDTHLTMLCTEKIVELAEKEKWTNCEFKPVMTG